MPSEERFTFRHGLILAALVLLPVAAILARAVADVPLLAMPAVIVIAGLIARHRGTDRPDLTDSSEPDEGGGGGGGGRGPRKPEPPLGPPLPDAEPGARRRDHDRTRTTGPARRGHRAPRPPVRV